LTTAARYHRGRDSGVSRWPVLLAAALLAAGTLAGLGYWAMVSARSRSRARAQAPPSAAAPATHVALVTSAYPAAKRPIERKPQPPPATAAPPESVAEGLSEAERRTMLGRISSVMGVARPRRGKPTSPQALRDAERAVKEARQLIRKARGSPEAHKARYYAFRYLQILGEAEQAELEFDAYLGEVATAEGVAAACKLLEKEGLREERARNFAVALKRFQLMLAFGGREGETAAVAHARMANVYARQRLGDLAIQARLHRYLLRVYLCNREYEDALRHGKALVALPGNEAQKANDEARLAMVIEKTEGPAKAAQIYRQILKKYPQRFCSTAKWRLKEIESKIEDAVLDVNP